MTGITVNGVMSDEDFINLLGLDNYCLPIEELRQSEDFMNFLYKHSPSELDLDVDDIVKKCEEKEFQEWLSDDKNNSRFIKHWIHKDEIDKFAKKSIFIEYEGELFKSTDLYYDFEINCKGIDFLRRFIPHLCQKSKCNFETEENWQTFVEKYFLSFSAESMINTYILPDEKAMALLNVPDNSVAFYHYLSSNKVDLKDNNVKIPYITEDDEPCSDYENNRYFYGDEVQSLIQETWLGENIERVKEEI